MILARFRQDPDETRVKTLDYSEWLQDTEIINSVVATVSPVTSPPFLAPAVKSDTRVTITSSGGVDNTTYEVTVTITTSIGQVKEDCVHYIVEEIC